jgi:hypothetical protein
MDDSAARAAMTLSRWQELKAILCRALECDSDAARLEFLKESCGDDAFLRMDLEKLLAHDDRTWCDEAFLAGLKATLFSNVTAIPVVATDTEPALPRDE